MPRPTIIKCDHCDNNATVHVTEIKGGEKEFQHLCEKCAEGLLSQPRMPINELLENFVMGHLGSPEKETDEGNKRAERQP